jgi:trans-2,3-dihydro-3-hydroxyanthranilate isomerase
MSLEHAFFTADVFTDTPFGGNQLAVFPDARGIPEDRMQDVAREFNFSETSFVLPAVERVHTRRLRIFNPAGELPFAGHPTLGTAFGPPPPPAARLAAVVGLDETDVLQGPEAPQAVSCGVPFLFVPLRDRKALARARPDLAAWEGTLSRSWASMLFLFCRDPERAGSDLRARMFAPGSGIPEDPATGGAAVALAGYPGVRDPRRDGTLRWIVEQGFEMGRPSLLEVEADKRGGEIAATRVGGASVLVSRGTMRIPPGRT